MPLRSVDESLHLRIPTACLMPEMDTAFKKLSCCDDGHGRVPSLPASARAGVRLFSTELFGAA